MDVDLVIWFEEMISLNFSTTWGSKADVGVTIISSSIEGAAAEVNRVMDKNVLKRGVVKIVQKINFAEDVETVRMV